MHFINVRAVWIRAFVNRCFGSRVIGRVVVAVLSLTPLLSSAQEQPFRPLYHFSPHEKWMNDPNGLVFFNGTYHLFFQYYPKDIVWGPMHWGHATSPDLIHWTQLPIALYPDSLGYIFSGSAVVDSANTSGFGRKASRGAAPNGATSQIPLVAIFTHHDPNGEKSGSNTYQNQSLAYSLDGGATWTKYTGNPVLKNPGITDFRDPSVSWHKKEKKWVLSLATKDRITFYSSPDLKEWKKESEFGATLGGHGGVWECPNLFPLDGHWVLLVSNNPGGPNGGSGTQYFIGDWDGHRFTPAPGDTATKWIDYGPDDYAGVTFNNTGGRRLFLGWMSNWDYANKVPTATWRNAMTVPRALGVKRVGSKLYLMSKPVAELDQLVKNNPVAGSSTNGTSSSNGSNSASSSNSYNSQSGIYSLSLQDAPAHSWTLHFSNTDGQELIVGYDQSANQYFIDRSHSGHTDFHPGFGAKYRAPRIGTGKTIKLKLLMDVSSVELFADDGLTVMTAVFFPDKPLSQVRAEGLAPAKLQVTDMTAAPVK